MHEKFRRLFMKKLLIGLLALGSISAFSAESCSAYVTLQFSGYLVQSTCSDKGDAFNCRHTGCFYPSSVYNKASAYSYVSGLVMDKYFDKDYDFISERITRYFQKEERRGLRRVDVDSNNPKTFVMKFIKH
jgi:hypothetical protein